MNTTLNARFAVLPGSHHHYQFKNRQDMCHLCFVHVEGGEVEAAVVGCDGCSQSAAAEIGAGLVAYYAAETLTDLVTAYGMEDDTALELLYTSISEYLRGLIAIQPNGAMYLEKLDIEQAGGPLMNIEEDYRLRQVYSWIGNHLLFTIVGAYIGVDGVLAFQRGDGGYCVDDMLHTEDYRDLPPYLAYMFFPKKKLAEGEARLKARNLSPKLPAPGFTSCYFPNATRAAIFSDGMPLSRVDEVWSLVDPIDQWDLRKDRLTQLALRWHQIGDLQDDLFLAVFNRR